MTRLNEALVLPSNREVSHFIVGFQSFAMCVLITRLFWALELQHTSCMVIPDHLQCGCSIVRLSKAPGWASSRQIQQMTKHILHCLVMVDRQRHSRSDVNFYQHTERLRCHLPTALHCLVCLTHSRAVLVTLCEFMSHWL